jgi:H+/Na+-translocating ferredoxin:NAD+ oxidoreductase subunit B
MEDTMDVYDQLRETLDKHPSGAPDGPNIHEILSTLFTQEEAQIASNMTFRPKPVEFIAQRAGVTADEAHEHLERLADKGLVFAREKDGEWGYALVPIMPGVFEFPYMKGVRTGDLDRLAELWETYLMVHVRELAEIGKPIARVVPIQEEVENEPKVLTYEMVYKLIDDAKVVGLAHCACRTAFAHCDGPLEACMLFDETCKFLVERGFGRYVEKDEMKKLLREFDKQGLVHNVNNSQDKLQFICNCCPCCCGFMRVAKAIDKPALLATSGFVAKVDEELCSGCAVCEERCPMDAIEIVDDVPVINEDRCIGCALCVTGCDTDAMELARREVVPQTPATMPEWGVDVLKAQGKLDEFIELLK